ncbi:baseplate J/gp47 family protein [Sphingopyxis sp. GW247-27LB]|uniref:baseplate J/gp47 family protein n=1 Tax=Sphingopyxis sp. GW247-27LB TaxID=2012632 RepID=UPI001595169E|nr:baseplate J/gp47 family protein [Sphingopyxis sp. GW247-27LB]
MPFNRPTLSGLIERIRADLDSRLPGADARLPASVLDVLARSYAGTASNLYGYVDWLARQILPDTAEAELLGRHAAIWGLTRKAAIGATGSVALTGVEGTPVPAGTALIRDDEVEYRTTAAVAIGAGATSVAVEEVAGGPAGDTATGTVLRFVAPIAGVNAAATVEAPGIAGGAAEEDDEALRARLLTRIRTPPKGGAVGDYEQWTLEFPEVTRAWVFPLWMGAGTVGVTFVLDNRPDILPLPADIEAVDAWLAPLRPVTADVVVFAPEAFPIDLRIKLVPDTADVRAAVVAELDDFFARDAQPGGTIYLSRLREAISIAAGETWHDLQLPELNVEVAPGSLPMLGEVEWV